MIKRGLMFCLLFIISISLLGCGNEKVTNDEMNLSLDMTYEGKDLELQNISGTVKQLRVKGEYIYILADQDTKECLYKVSIAESQVEEIPISFSENEKVDFIYIDDNNKIYCLNSIEDKDCHSELVEINTDGTEVNRIDIQEQLMLGEIELLDCITVDGTGNIIVASLDMVYMLNSEMELIKKISTKDQYDIKTFVRTKTGNVVCAMQKDDAHAGGKLFVLQTENGEWGASLPLVDDPEIDECCLMEGEKYDFYYKDGGGIYGYDIENEEWEKILDARCSLLTVEDIEKIVGENKESFFGMMTRIDDDEKKEIITCYSKINPEEYKDKKIITYAGYNVTNKLRKVAREFNKAHKDCRIEIKLYEDEEHTKMAMDMISGKVPDIFPMYSLDIPMEQLVEKGILADLTPYYESDKEIHKEDIIPSVLEAMKINDKLYSVSPDFSIITAVCKADDMNGKVGWTVEEMREILREKGEDSIPFDDTDKESMLYEFLISSLNDFINWETGECDFCSKDFKDILELCNGGIITDQMTDKEYEELNEEIDKKMKEGKVLATFSQNLTLDDIQLAKQKYDGNIQCIGLPARDRQGSYLVLGEQYGIYAGSDVKKEAWEFIKMVMSEDYQINVNYIKYGMLPTRKDALQWKLQAQMSTEAYEDSYGNWIEPIETDVWYTDSGEERRIGPASQEEVDILLDLIDRTKKHASLDDEGAMIIMEEASAYFNGKKSVDKVAEIIQKRMTTYVNEQK